MPDLFLPATREATKARVGLCGPSGSGKTFTALTLAATFGERTAVVDTEHGSASKYAKSKKHDDGFVFDTVKPTSFDPRDLVKMIAVAAHDHYDTIVVDSMSHYWFGPGGVLELVDAATKRNSGNSFAGWKAVRPIERALIEALLGFPGHVIVTMRTKTEWVVEENERGKKQPRKIGTKPEQRDNIEYEFDVVGDLDQDNILLVTKTRCPELAGAVVAKPDSALAKTILDWLDDGEVLPDARDYRDRALEPDADQEQIAEIGREVRQRGLMDAAVIDDTGDDTTLGDLLRRRYAETGQGGNEAEEAQ